MTESTKPKDPRNAIGATGEAAVRAHVIARGWTVIDHNVRWRDGELDLIGVDASTLVFAEVKTLIGRGSDGTPAFSPFESIGERKQQQVRKLARRWLVDELPRQNRMGVRLMNLRFDAFAVTLTPDGRLQGIEHLEDAF